MVGGGNSNRNGKGKGRCRVGEWDKMERDGMGWNGMCRLTVGWREGG